MVENTSPCWSEQTKSFFTGEGRSRAHQQHEATEGGLVLQNMVLDGWTGWAESGEKKGERTGQSGRDLGRRTRELFVRCFK